MTNSGTLSDTFIKLNVQTVHFLESEIIPFLFSSDSSKLTFAQISFEIFSTRTLGSVRATDGASPAVEAGHLVTGIHVGVTFGTGESFLAGTASLSMAEILAFPVFTRGFGTRIQGANIWGFYKD